MASFRAWMKWIFHGRAELNALRASLQRQIDEQHKQIEELAKRPDAPLMGQPVRESPQVRQTKTWREFAQIADQGDYDDGV